MRMALRLVAVACVLGLVAPAFAAPTNGAGFYGGQVDYDRVGGYYTGGGGEFTLSGPGLLLSNAAYSASTRGIGGNFESFQTFCLERTEFTAQPMDVWVSTQFVGGGTPGSHAWEGGTGAGDDLDPRTAYLYTQFAQGPLSSYTYTAGASRSASAGELQEAIWYLEGESGLLDGQAATWVTEATTAVSTGAWTGIGSVRILQMYWGGDRKQDQLYLVVGAPGAVLLGMIGLGLAGWVRQRIL